MSDFGANFKRAREARGVGLSQIAKETRISTRFLHAIETEDFNVLPGGIFNRGFIRTYALRVGLDPEQAVSEYERLTEDRDPEPVARASLMEKGKAGPRFYAIAGAALVLLIVLFYIFSRESTQNAPAVDEVSLPPVSAPRSPISDPKEELAEPAASANAALVVEMQVREPTWISLLLDGERIVIGETLQPGDTRRYTAQGSIQMTIGNAGGLTLKVNDHELPALGTKGQVRSLEITTESLKSLIGG